MGGFNAASDSLFNLRYASNDWLELWERECDNGNMSRLWMPAAR
jgi:hypothetical protein